jgi:ankyrin repeat protein
LYHIKCEEQYLALLNTTDADNRTVLHYAAASRGTSTVDALSFNSNRFFVSRSSEYAPGAPFILFPGDGWVCRRTGDLWQPVYYEFPEDHPPQSPPDSYVSVKEILRARSDPSFSDPRDVHGASPLHYATVTGDVRSIRALLERGADPFAVTALNASTLDLASSRVVRVALMPMENAVQISCGLKMQRAGMASTSSTARSPLVKRSTGRVYGEGAGEEDLSGTRKRAADKALLALLGFGEDINLRSGIKMQAPLHLAAEKAALDIVEVSVCYARTLYSVCGGGKNSVDFVGLPSFHIILTCTHTHLLSPLPTLNRFCSRMVPW